MNEPPTTTEQLRAAVDLPPGTATWVLLAHAVTMLNPLVVVWAVYAYPDFVAERAHAPLFFFIGSGVLMAGSAFEVAQNTLDRWYLTPETASCEGRAFCDLCFYTLICAGLGCYAHAAAGDLVLPTVIAMAAPPYFAWAYATDRAPFPALGLVGITSSVSLFLALGDPVVFLQTFVGTGMTQLFFKALLKTRNQALHGFTTIGNAIGMWSLPWAIAAGAAGEPVGWWVSGAILTLAVALGVGVWPWISKLSATPRPSDGGGNTRFGRAESPAE